MRFSAFLRKKISRRPVERRLRSQPARLRPELEALEDRLAPALAVTQFSFVQNPGADPNGPTGFIPAALTAGPNGNLWVAGTQNFANGSIQSRIGQVTPAGALTLFDFTPNVHPQQLIKGSDGNVWFTNDYFDPQSFHDTFAIDNITPAGAISAVASFPFSNSVAFPNANVGLNWLTAGPDGNLWFSETNQKTGAPTGPNGIGRITTAGVVTSFTLAPGIIPGQITTGPDGNLWFMEGDPNSPGSPIGVGKITPTGDITTFKITTPDFSPTGLLASGPDGNVWFTGSHPSNGTTVVGRITPAGAIKMFNVPASFRGSSITGGPDGNVWLVGKSPATGGSELARVTPAGVITVVGAAPAVGTGTITKGPDGNLWFTTGKKSIYRVSGLGNISQTKPAITSPARVIFPQGEFSTFQVTTTGSPVPSLSLIKGKLPAGVTFDAASGELSGVPADKTLGTYPLTFFAASPAGTVAQSFTLIVGSAPTIKSAASTTLVAGKPALFAITTSGFPAAKVTETGALPKGLALVIVPGAPAGITFLKGTLDPNSGGVYAITLKASNGVDPDATQNFTLTVNQAAKITSAAATKFTVGAAGTFNVTATGYPKPVLSEVGALPAGLTFDPGTGVLSGTPAAGTARVYTIVFQGSLAGNVVVKQNFTLTVNEAPAFTSADNTTFFVGVMGSFKVTATGFPAPTIAVTSALPKWLNYNAVTHVLSGKPPTTAVGNIKITIVASNGVGAKVTQNFTLNVSLAQMA